MIGNNRDSHCAFLEGLENRNNFSVNTLTKFTIDFRTLIYSSIVPTHII